MKRLQNKIHYGTKYGQLGVNAQREIWQTFLAKASTKMGSAKCTSAHLETLAKWELNGREAGYLLPWCGRANCSVTRLNNAVSIARALASYRSTCVNLQSLTIAIDAIKEFQSDFEARSWGMYT
jgi:hypothetical protein